MDPFDTKSTFAKENSVAKLTIDNPESSLETPSFWRLKSIPRDRIAHPVTAIAFYLLAILCLTPAGLLEDDLFIGAIIGLGFGQLTVTAIWLSLRWSGFRLSLPTLTVAIEIVAMLMMAVFFANFQDSVFNLTLIAASLVFFSIILGTISLIRKYYRITLALNSESGSSEVKSAQYGILDLLIAMSAVAILTAGFNYMIKFKSSRDEVTGMIQVFGLIICFYFLLAWPVVVACLSRRWMLLTLFSTLSCIGLFFVQVSIFTAFLGAATPDVWGFIASLDLPFVLCVLTHAIIARCHGYRLTILNGNSNPTRQGGSG